MEQIFKVKKSEDRQRLDRFLYDHLGTWSHRHIKQALDSKNVFVNGQNIFISSWNLRAGDKVRLLADNQPKNTRLIKSHYLQILLEDPYILVVMKPAFVDYDTFVLHVGAYLKRQNKNAHDPYVGQVHRLDKETSGVMLFTKKKIANTLSDQFRERRVQKFYLGIVFGRIETERGIIRNLIEKGKFEGGKKARIVSDKKKEIGMEAHTEYEVLERYEKATLIRFSIKTGRTHQIRIHMANLGYPLLGDKIYGQEILNASCKPSSSKKLIKPLINRQALHAWRIDFAHPVSGKKISMEAPIPKDMQECIDRLRDGQS